MIVAVFRSKFLHKDPISDEQALARIIARSQTYLVRRRITWINAGLNYWPIYPSTRGDYLELNAQMIIHKVLLFKF